MGQYWHFRLDLLDITAFSILLCSYNYSFIEFPLYHALGPSRTQRKLLDSVALAMLMTVAIYVTTSLLSLYLFGSSMDPNVLVNVAAEGFNWGSVFVRVAFAIVLACHIPYVFYYGKEALLIVVDEVMNNSTSADLRKKKRAIEELPEHEPAYLSMNKTLYTCLTVALYSLTILGATLVPDVAIIFDYMAALSISGMQFILPGAAYIRLYFRTSKGKPLLLALAVSYVILGIVCSAVILYNNLRSV
jgi:hypothetical protein